MQYIEESAIASYPGAVDIRKDVFVHTFFTENTMMLNIISSIAEGEGLDIPDLESAVDDGQNYLEKAGTITIEPFDSAWIDYDKDGLENDLSITLQVTNQAGHKLPTSIPIRRVFIHFAVYGIHNNGHEFELFSSGDTDREGRIIGVDSDYDYESFEPHYDLISDAEQVQVYEGIMGKVINDETFVTYTLLKASTFLKDNRLLPEGMVISQAPEEIRPKGAALKDKNFKGGTDSITYIAKNIRNRAESFRIEAELKDQTLSYAMVHDLEEVQDLDDSNSCVISQFLYEYDHHKVHYELIHSDEMFISAAD